MQSEKRFLLAIGLTAALLYVWTSFFAPKPPIRPVETPKTEQAPPAVSETGAPTAAAALAPAPTQGKPKAIMEPAKLVETETPLTQITWTNQPGAPSRIVLKKFRTETRPNSPQIELVPFQGKAPPPLQWDFETQGKNWSDAAATYDESSSGDGQISFGRALDKRLQVQKTFTWKPDTYWLDQKVVVLNQGTEPLKLKASVKLSSGEEHHAERTGASSWLGARTVPLRLTAFINEKAIYWTTKEALAQKAVPPGEIRWAGFNSQYFLLTAIPIEGRWEELKVSAIPRQDSPAGQPIAEEAALSMTYPPYEIPAGGSQTYLLRLYAGPKDIGLLEKTGSQLDRAIDLGDWLGWIARPMLFLLRWLYSIIPNYGIAIILLTVAVRLLMFPLAQKQATSMKRMQAHKPQMDALKEKYKDNKEAYSRELMSYMKNNKINPMGGCLLLLPQLPIFFALYRVLFNSIELRHAPFAFWIHDLSAHDPYFVLPVLLGISMFLQQKMTPNPTADSSQQTMMKVMPVMFTAMMIFLPAGLNLYIFVSTLWGVVQQYWVQRDLSPAATRAEKVSQT